jgi:hypothetical protein
MGIVFHRPKHALVHDTIISVSDRTHGSCVGGWGRSANTGPARHPSGQFGCTLRCERAASNCVVISAGSGRLVSRSALRGERLAASVSSAYVARAKNPNEEEQSDG